MSKIMRTSIAVGIAATVVASVANAQVRRPSGPHAFFNFIPFGGSQVCTQHQVFDASLWSGPMEISALGFAANNGLNGQQYDSDITIKLGYTTRVPGQNPPVGLDVILANNPSGTMTQVFNARVSEVLVGSGTEDFSFILQFDTPFCYDPALGNLLVEIRSAWVSGADLSVGRTSGSAESSRAYNSTRFGDAASPTTATRMDFYEGPCNSCPSDYRLSQIGSCSTANKLEWSGAPASPNHRLVYNMTPGSGSVNVPGCGSMPICLSPRGIALYPGPFVFSGASGSTPSFNAPCGLNVQLITPGPACKKSNAVTL